MNIEIITTGEEVLSGQIVDTNASWLSQQLERHGMPVRRRGTVGDRREDLVEAFLESARRADAVIVNGGLGPTVDDLSAACAAEALNEPLVEHTEWSDTLRDKFQRLGRDLSERNLKQAMLPKSATVIDNPIGTACGFRIRLHQAWVYFTPGVPSEFKRMVHEQIVPDLKARFQIEASARLRRLHCFGIAESRLDTLLSPIPLPEGVKLGFRAHLPTVEIKIMGLGAEEQALTAGMERVADAIKQQVGNNIICEENHTVASHIQELMVEKGFTLALAESCTGGMIASQVVEIPDSSRYFERGFVTYTNEAKMEHLGVSKALLAQHGAVSLEVARAMAEGARRAAGSSHALSVTGVAGPGGGSEAKPVGTVAFGLATPSGTLAQVLKAPDWGRTPIRKMSAAIALDMLRRYLEQKPITGEYDLVKLVREETTGTL